jgi:Zn-dependent protease with chaperone function
MMCPNHSSLHRAAAIFIGIAVCAAPASALAQEQAPGSLDDLIIEEVELKPGKPNRLDTEKWAKVKYDRVYTRRTRNGLPAELRLAPRDKLMRDPALGHAEMTAIVPQPEAEAVLGEQLLGLVGHIPADVPDINILFNDADAESAKAVATGQIIFQAGILEEVKYLDQAIFLLAHEVAHIAYDHFKNEENRQTLNKVATTAALIAKGGDAQRTANSDELMAYMVFSEILMGPQWSRSDERAADELAIDLLVRSGMSLEGARSIFRSLAAIELRRDALIKERCSGSRGLVSLLGIRFLEGGQAEPVPPECAPLNNALGKLVGSITRSHASAADRLKLANEYIESRYPNYTDPGMSDLPDGLKVAVAVDGPVLRSTYAGRALEFLASGEIEIAARYAMAAYREDDLTTVKPRLAMYDLLKRAGRLEEAAQQLEVAIASGQASKAVYLLALQERLAIAAQARHESEAARVNDILRAVQAQYAANPMEALEDAKNLADAQNRAVSATEPDTARQDLLPPARAAYEDALALAVRAKDVFADNQEFVLQELEIRRILYPERAIEDLARCAGSSDEVIRDFCRNAQKMTQRGP